MSICLIWGKTIFGTWRMSYSIQENLNSAAWLLLFGISILWKPPLTSHKRSIYIRFPFHGLFVEKKWEHSSWDPLQAIHLDFWQKQSELESPELNSYGIKIEVKLELLSVVKESSFLFHLDLEFSLVLCGEFAEKCRQMQLVLTFQLSPVESVELCLLWNLIRFLCLTKLLLPSNK